MRVGPAAAGLRASVEALGQCNRDPARIRVVAEHVVRGIEQMRVAPAAAAIAPAHDDARRVLHAEREAFAGHRIDPHFRAALILMVGHGKRRLHPDSLHGTTRSDPAPQTSTCSHARGPRTSAGPPSRQHRHRFDQCNPEQRANHGANQLRMPPLEVQRGEQRANQDHAQQRERDHEITDFEIVIDQHDVSFPM
jgi:hypothetical protein